MIEAVKVVIIATSHALMGGTGEQTGVWLEELTTPYYEFLDAGYDVDVYSVAGGPIPIDPRSLKPDNENEASVERYLKDAKAKALFRSTPAIDALESSSYAAVFLPGGHGTMWDFPNSARLAEIVGAAVDSGKVIAAVCHGPAGLVAAKDTAGNPIVMGRRVAGFTNSEEDAAGLTDAVPFLLETRLRALGADYLSGPDFQPFVVQDGNLITGQNPASAKPVATLVISALQDQVAGMAAQ